jgi:hypothetical protein
MEYPDVKSIEDIDPRDHCAYRRAVTAQGSVWRHAGYLLDGFGFSSCPIHPDVRARPAEPPRRTAKATKPEPEPEPAPVPEPEPAPRKRAAKKAVPPVFSTG